MIDVTRSSCTACGACVKKCPKECITLRADENGFLMPYINESACVSCGLCDKACPIDAPDISSEGQKAYACRVKDETALALATSGGVFGAVADHVLACGGAVYGCAYESHLQASHIRVTDREALCRLYGSKYLQSHTRDSFKACEKDLKAGLLVLFSGTPCQIAGLKGYLGKDYDNLITVDIVCHGVSSQAYFDKFIAWLEEKENAVCTDYSFRSKKNAGWSVAGLSEFQSDKGRAFTKKQYYFSNYYFYYLAASIYRESCYTCRYTTLARQGDLTLGDLWGAEGMDLPFSPEKGCSLVLANTEKGRQVFEGLSLERAEISIETAVRYNGQLAAPSCPRYDREELLRQYREDTAEAMQRYFKKHYKKAILKGRIKYLVPKGIKQALLKIRYKR